MIKNQITTHKILIIALLLSLFIILTSVSGVHAASTVYVNVTGGNDSNDGSINHPYKTIEQAMKNVDENGTVKIADGTYKGKGNTNLTISKNMKIIGKHQKKTIINGEGVNWIFKVIKGVNVTIMNLTLANGTAGSGSTIYNQGTCNIRDCTFTGNKASKNGGAIYNLGIIGTVSGCTFKGNTANWGGAIFNDNRYSIGRIAGCIFISNGASVNGGAIYNIGTVNNMNNCIFTSNAASINGSAVFNWGTIINLNSCTFRSNTVGQCGGAICNYGICNVKHSTFTNNKGTETYSSGGAIYNDDIFTVSDCTFKGNTSNWGGAIANAGTMETLSSCTFVGNIANRYGGAIYTYGICNVTSCTFKDNTATRNGGAIYANGDMFITVLTVHFNRFVNNNAGTGNAIYSYDGSLDARYNWWGSNENPKNISNLITGQADKVDTDSWLVLTIKPHKNCIDANGKTTVTVDLLHDINGVYHDPASGHVPDGTIVTFSASSGTLNPITVELINGSAVTTLTAKSEGKSIIQAAVDNQTVSTEVTVNPVKPTPIDPVKPTPIKPDSPNSNGTQHNTVHAASTVGLQKTGMPLNYLLLGLIMVFGALGLRRK